MQKDIPQLVRHFTIQIPLPQKATIQPYKSAHTSGKAKKSKHKLDKFTYYKINEKQIIKVLYKDNDTYLLQGKYPFTDPQSKIQKFATLLPQQPKKIIKTEAAYIGHLEDNTMIVKKMDGVKLAGEGKQFDTVDDNFESIPINNPQRFEQFKKILGVSEKTLQMSIRVIIDESKPEQPYILDYEFFHRERQLKNSKIYKGQN